MASACPATQLQRLKIFGTTNLLLDILSMDLVRTLKNIGDTKRHTKQQQQQHDPPIQRVFQRIYSSHRGPIQTVSRLNRNTI